MKTHEILLCVLFSFPFVALSCPVGMQEHGDICVVPAYSSDDWIREQNDYIDSLCTLCGYTAPALSPEKLREFEERRKQLEAEAQEKREAHARGVWNFDSGSTPEGTLCVAIFSKYRRDEGGVVGVMGFQDPNPVAWLIFHGVGIPKPRKAVKLKITLQQDAEPAQTVQAFNYRLSREIGTIAFAVPGLAAALDGMRDEQSFRLSIDGRTVMTINWTNGAPMIEKLEQCAGRRTER
jgi:hypothetical protein